MLCSQGLETSSEASAFGCPVRLVLNPLNWSNGEGISEVFPRVLHTHTNIHIYINIYLYNIVYVGAMNH